jgi:ribosomal protein S18 acetylase RimI-like enzyme
MIGLMMLLKDRQGPLIALLAIQRKSCLLVAREDFGKEAAEHIIPEFLLGDDLALGKLVGPSFAIDVLMEAFHFPLPNKNVQTIIQADKILQNRPQVKGGLRKPSMKDAKWLFQMQSDYYESQSGEKMSREFVAQSVMAHLDAGHYWLWEVDGKPVSLLGTVHPVKGFGAQIEMLWTEESQRRKGYASALIAEAAEDILYCGAEFLSLQLFSENHGAKAFFETLGFREVGDYCFYDGGEHEWLWM